MKKVFVSILFSLCLSLHVHAQRSEPISIWNFDARVTSSIKMVHVNMVSEDITITGQTDEKATVELSVSGNSPDIRRRRWSDGEIKQELERSFTIIVKVEEGKLFVEAKQKASRPLFGLTFKITVPKQVNSDLRTTNGDINISNLSGSHDFITTNGDVKVEHISGSVTGRTTNGDITAKNSDGKISLTTTNGDINISNLSGDISTKTTNGRVRR